MMITQTALRQSLTNCLRCLFVAGLVEEGKHIFLVSLHAGLIERIDTQDVTADATRLLKEVDQLSEVVLVEFGNLDANLRNAAVEVCEWCAEFSLFVDKINTLSGEEVELVEVLSVGRNLHLAVGFGDGKNSFVHQANTFLNVLTHRVKVGREIHRRRENALAVLALGFAVELLPPLGELVEFRLEIHQTFSGEFLVQKVEDNRVM